MHAPVLRFTPTAWAKLLYLRDYGKTEVGGFGITAPDDPLLVTDFKMVKQECSSVTVDFDDESVADFFDSSLAAGHKFGHFDRIWIHTHPGCSPSPSGTDVETFDRVFSDPDWAVMFIIAEEGKCFARLRINQNLNSFMDIPVEIDYGVEFDATDQLAWEEEYRDNVSESTYTYTTYTTGSGVVNNKAADWPLQKSDDGKPNRFTPADFDMLTEEDWQEIASSGSQVSRSLLDENDGGMAFQEDDFTADPYRDVPIHQLSDDQYAAWEEYVEGIEDAEEQAYERQLMDEDREFRELLEAEDALDRRLNPEERERARRMTVEHLRKLHNNDASISALNEDDFDYDLLDETDFEPSDDEINAAVDADIEAMSKLRDGDDDESNAEGSMTRDEQIQHDQEWAASLRALRAKLPEREQCLTPA